LVSWVAAGQRVRFWLRLGNVGEFGTEPFETVEIFDGAAVEALGLGLVAEENGPGGESRVRREKPLARQKLRFWPRVTSSE